MDFLRALYFFLFPLSRASSKMPRLHRLAHKAPVMQASVQCACTARQKHDSALYATRRHNRWRHCDCQPLTSSIVASSCIKVSEQHDYQFGAKVKKFVHPLWKMFAVGYSSWVRKGLLLVNRDRLSSNLVPRVLCFGLGGPAPSPNPGKSALVTRLILLTQILYNDVKRLLRPKMKLWIL